MTFHRTLIVVGAGLAVLATAPLAHAQQKGEFGAQGQFIFSADRLVPLIAWSKQQITNNNQNGAGTTSAEQTSISLLAGTTGNFLAGGSSGGLAGGGVFVGEFESVYTFPRVGFDYTIIPNLTVGGDLFVIFGLAASVTTPRPNGNVSTNQPTTNAFGIAPRVGYILGLTDVFGIWLRGGISFYDASATIPSGITGCNSSPNNSFGGYVFGVDLDPQFVITPINHFSFEVGPMVDLGFAGSASSTTFLPNSCNNSQNTSYNYQQYNLGVAGGLLGWF